ncbi:hypothetical protein FA15DRAFT_671361 [Coprinopsis marcescibilis]|uniref:Uncharacterized protein n=1 Tax=Coprinopsis marcescibilis TaxID=230819 RepID=A0A5C3KQQ6_COPMA|nr:hypothetical protein FA15DRAFT_671361 [Coprinopsis marcescibilis]
MVWSLLIALLATFLVFHLWSFDRFKCLRWDNGPNSGAFKRIMTYSYIITVPLIFTFALGITIIKYDEGFIVHPLTGDIIPKPYSQWGKTAHEAVFPLMLLFSISWGLEMVTHLEELCFWLFLVNSGSSQQNWFQSLYFKTWVVGSCVAVAYMPLVTILTRSDLAKAEAYTFLAGSLGSLSLTLWFTPILWTFPSFLDNLRREGVDTSTIVRLTKFSELNSIRVAFRFLFTIPLLILGVDGVRPHNHINEKMAYTDFLVILAGFGCTISSAITLVIFFPRSIEGEIAARDAVKERKRTRAHGVATTDANPSSQLDMSQYVDSRSQKGSSAGGTYLLTNSPVKTNVTLQDVDGLTDDDHRHPPYDRKRWSEDERPHLPIRPNRRRGKDVEMGGVGDSVLTESNLSMHNHYSNLNPAVTNFTSPIDFAYASQAFDKTTPRLTFAQR